MMMDLLGDTALLLGLAVIALILLLGLYDIALEITEAIYELLHH